MRRIILAMVSVVAAITLHAQADTTRVPGMGFFMGVGIGPGFLLQKSPDLHGEYGHLLIEHAAYVDVRAEAGVLWKEKMGVRVVVGRMGRRGNAYDFHTYLDPMDTAYHYLYEYSDFYSGHSYSYITPQFVYRIGTEPFNVLLAGGMGIGLLCTPHGRAELQENRSNNYREINYYGGRFWNYNVQAGAEVAYMRQITPHLFCNTGVYVNWTSVFTDFTYRYTVEEYQQPVSVDQTYDVKQPLNRINAGVFLNFQWNAKESARAFYY